MVEEPRPYVSWARAALVRAVKTFGQALVAMIPAGAMIQAVDWKVVLGTAALAAVASLATSLWGLPECDGGPLDEPSGN